MAVDIVDLTRFYEAPLGAHVQARLVDEIARIWPHGAGANEAVLAYGYGLPLADSLWPAADWHFLMPAQQGALAPKADDPAHQSSLALSDESRWPMGAPCLLLPIDAAFGHGATARHSAWDGLFHRVNCAN